MIVWQKAFFYPVLAAFVFSLMNGLIKVLALTIPEGEIAFFRGLFGAIIVMILMWRKGEHLSSHNRGWLLLRGVMGGIGMLLSFIAVAHMKLADASILFQSTGIFVLIFSVFFLHESLPKGAILWLTIIAAALVIAVKPWNYSSYSLYAFAALGSAVFAAAAYTTIRKLALLGKHSNYEIMFYFMVTGMVVAGVYSFSDFVWPTLHEGLLLIIMGVLSVVAQFFLTGSFVSHNAVVAQFMQYIGAFFNAAVGYVAFNEVMSNEVLIAGAIMFLSSLQLAKLKERESLPK